jgi:hypothetical protein
VPSWPFYRTASMGCAEVHRPAADIAMEPCPATSEIGQDLVVEKSKHWSLGW